MNADVVVVGSGAAGGWAAKTLSQNGLRTLVLEAGPLFALDGRVDRALHDGRYQHVQSRSSAYGPATAPLFVDDQDCPYETPKDAPFAWYRGRQAGGRLLLWAGVCLRMSANEFAEPVAGRSWPLNYEDLVPHYRAVELFMRVTGGGEHSPATPAPDAVTHQPLTAGERRLAQALDRSWPDRQVLASRVSTVDPGALLASALASGQVRIRTDSVVSHIEVDRSGTTATGVVFVDRRTGKTHRASAAAVVLCASTIETVRILLHSRGPLHPDGLGNDHDQLGRYLVDHVAGVAIDGRVPGHAMRPEPTAAQQHVPVCHIPDFGNHGDRPYSGRYGVTAFVPEVLPANQLGAGWAAAPGAEAFYRMWAIGEVLPCRDNMVTLGSTTDRWGIPTPRIRLTYGEHERAMAGDQLVQMLAMSEAAGFQPTSASAEPLPPGSSVHELGGAAMGRDHSTSVVDPLNRVWSVPNVIVADGACFPTAGWQNPTLTIMALAARACVQLARSARNGRLKAEWS